MGRRTLIRTVGLVALCVAFASGYELHARSVAHSSAPPPAKRQRAARVAPCRAGRPGASLLPAAAAGRAARPLGVGHGRGAARPVHRIPAAGSLPGPGRHRGRRLLRRRSRTRARAPGSDRDGVAPRAARVEGRYPARRRDRLDRRDRAERAVLRGRRPDDAREPRHLGATRRPPSGGRPPAGADARAPAGRGACGEQPGDDVPGSPLPVRARARIRRSHGRARAQHRRDRPTTTASTGWCSTCAATSAACCRRRSPSPRCSSTRE